MTELADRDETAAPALPEEFREVLAYLVTATERDPDAHCTADS